MYSHLGYFEGANPCFASASSDGTVAISHCNSGEGIWGVEEEDNQIMLSQKCVGMGTLDCLFGRFAVCGLRGGTIYLVPVAEHGQADSKQSAHQNDITMVSVPVDSDGDDDGLVRYLQGFTAGMAQVLQWKCGMGKQNLIVNNKQNESETKSVAMVGWPGGIIDVFEICPAKINNNEVLLREMVDRGAVTKLVERLLEIGKDHPLISSDLWSRAWDECHKVKNLDTILGGIKDSGSVRGFAAMKTLLLSI